MNCIESVAFMTQRHRCPDACAAEFPMCRASIVHSDSELCWLPYIVEVSKLRCHLQDYSYSSASIFASPNHLPVEYIHSHTWEI